MYNFNTPPLVISAVLAVLALAGSAVCVTCAPAVIAATGKIDPGEIVADELAGQAVTFLAVNIIVFVRRFAEAGMAIEAFSNRQIWGTAVLGFVLFRAFDIVKFWPICIFERLPKGWGILADDLIAAVFAAIGLLIGIRLWIVG